jgi:hypothetical protein
MLRDIKRVGDRVPVLPKMATRPTQTPGNPQPARSAPRDPHPKPATAPRPLSDKPAQPTAPFEAPTDSRRSRRVEIASIAALLGVVMAGWWFMGSEAADRARTTMPPTTQAGDDLAQVKQELQQERDNVEKLSGQLAQAAQEPAQNQELTDLRRALQQERDNAEKLNGQLVRAWQELRSQAVALADKAAQDQELTDLRQALQQERDNAEKLGGQVARAWQELRSQAVTLADKEAQDQALADLRQALQRTAEQSGKYQELLAQERARNRGLEQQLAARQDTPSDHGRNAAANLPGTAKPAQATATEKSATAQLLAGDNPEAARLVARARLLLSQGNIGAARTVLERAAESGSIPALFGLAETYDPAVLSAWRTVGTQGDVAKAREFYARALAGGIHEAKDRLNALP